jgi:hypothetical protein
LALFLTVSPVRTAAASFLRLFRVEKITPVAVDVGLSELPDYIDRYSPALTSILGEDVDVSQSGEPTEVQSAGRASELAGFKVRLPSQLTRSRPLLYRPAKTLRLIVNRQHWQALLNAAGHSDFIIPETLDGQPVTIEVPAIVAALYGDCDSDESSGCTVLVQSKTPTIEVPPELDIESIGQLFLEVLGLSPEEAAAYSASVDWLTTLVMPVPRNVNYHHIPDIDGVSGVALENPYAQHGSRYVLAWVKDGILHGLWGISDLTQGLQLADSLQ